MFFLKLFGGLRVEGNGAALTGRAAQRRRLALLAILGAAPTRILSRDKLIALLWPESDAERARHQLAACVYDLRQALGEAAILAAGDELRLNPARIGSDVWEFEQALAAGERERVVALYRGALLDGFFLGSAPEFERWVDAERERLARSYARAVEALAEAGERNGDWVGAVEWWRRLAAQDPYCSRVALRLMQALEAAGDRAGALQQARLHEMLLRTELDLAADPEVAALAERIRDGRPLAPVPQPDATEEEDRSFRVSETLPPTAEHAVSATVVLPPEASASFRASLSPAIRRWRLPALGAAVVAALALFAWGITGGESRLWAGGAEAAPPIRSIAVLPLENLSGNPEQEYFADGMTDALITELARYGSLRVISRTSVVQYKRGRKPLPEIARELNVEAVVQGAVLRHGDRVRITAQLIRAATDQHLWAESYERDLRDVLALQGEIVRDIADQIRLKLTPQQAARLATERSVNFQAYEAYLKGRYFWEHEGNGGLKKAAEHYERAIKLEPGYAQGYAGLADAYLHMDDAKGLPREQALPQAAAAAQAALALDTTNADARTALAHVFMHEREWAAADREFRRAIELNPSHAVARHLYSIYCATQGRLDQAVQEARRALELDPLSYRTNLYAGFALYWARRYGEAIEQWRRTLELYPKDERASFGIARAYLLQGNYREGLAWMRRGVELAVDAPAHAHLAYAYAMAGEARDAQQILAELQGDVDRGRPEDIVVVAAYAYLGSPDESFRWLDKAVAEDHRWMMLLKVEPAFDPLRSDSRFTALLRRMRLE